jgi:hypothetical protein
MAALVGAGAASAQPAKIDDQTALQIEALSRLKGVDLEANAPLKTAVLKILDKTRGTPQFVEIVRDFNLKGQGTTLLDYALKHPNESSAIEAFRMAVAELGKAALDPLLDGEQGRVRLNCAKKPSRRSRGARRAQSSCSIPRVMENCCRSCGLQPALH